MPQPSAARQSGRLSMRAVGADEQGAEVVLRPALKAYWRALVPAALTVLLVAAAIKASMPLIAYLAAAVGVSGTALILIATLRTRIVVTDRELNVRAWLHGARHVLFTRLEMAYPMASNGSSLPSTLVVVQRGDKRPWSIRLDIYAPEDVVWLMSHEGMQPPLVAARAAEIALRPRGSQESR